MANIRRETTDSAKIKKQLSAETNRLKRAQADVEAIIDQIKETVTAARKTLKKSKNQKES